ncbi:hypothetical protein D3C85_1301490 [compost metagenome]
MSEIRPKFFTNVRSIRRKYNYKIFQYLTIFTFQVGQFIYCNHKAGDRSVKRESFYIILYFLNDFMQGLQFRFRRHGITYIKDPFFIVEQAPEFTKELKYAFNTIGIPWFTLLQWSQEHFIHS